jgi:hypothetical protein
LTKPATTSPPPPPRQASALLPLLGGALAAIGGFVLSHFDFLGLAPAPNTDEVAALSSQLQDAKTQDAAALDRISGEMANLGTRLAALESAPAPAAPDLSRLDAVEARLSTIEALPNDGSASTAALAAKLAELDRRLAALPATSTSPDIQQQLAAALARLDAAETEAEARAAEAETAAATARRVQALDALTTAVAAGRPFKTELEALEDPALSAALTAVAGTGVPTLEKLAAEFADPAREALRIARDASVEDGWSDRLVDFLAAQTGARSLTPREGTTADAVLSRADFALSEGRVADAVTEIGTLDVAVKAPFDAWLASAGAYVTANAALQSARGE